MHPPGTPIQLAPAIRTAMLAVFAGLSLGYLFLFMQQPSVLGLQTESGTATRWLDLLQSLLWDQLLAATLGGDHLEQGVLDRIPILLHACLWLVVATWVGRPLTEGLPSLSQLERICIACLGGLAILSTTTLLIGLMGGIRSRWPLAIAVLLECAVSGWLQRHPNQAPVNQGSECEDRRSHHWSGSDNEERILASQPVLWAWRLVPVLTVLLGCIYLLGSLVTPFEFDVVEYHLEAPKEFYQNGQITFIDHNVYCNMPLGAEMHALAAMVLLGKEDSWWTGGLVGKLLIGCSSLLAAAVVGGFVSRHASRIAGWAAAGLLLAVPGNLHVATCGLIDSVVGAYLVAMLVILHSTVSNRTRMTQSNVFLASLLAGGAGACKYPGVVFAVVPCLVILGFYIGKHRKEGAGRKSWQLLIALGLGLVVSLIPWLLKNMLWVGNPVYPLATNLFGSGNLSAEQVTRWQLAHRVPLGPLGTSPYGWRAAWQSVEQLFLGSSFLSPTLYPLALIGLVTSWMYRSKRKWYWILFVCVACWVVIVWWIATHRIDRFWLPLLPLASVAAGAGVAFCRQYRGLNGLAVSLVLFGLVYGVFISATGAFGDNRFFVSLDALRQDAGSEELPGRLPRSTGWINDKLSEAKILLVGEARVFDFRWPILYATCFNSPPGIARLANQSAGEQTKYLTEIDCTHVMIHWSELARYRSPGNYGFNAWPTVADIDQMVQEGVLRRVKEWPLDPRSVELLEVIRFEN